MTDARPGFAPILESAQAAELRPLLARDAQLVGLDLGDRTIGMAISDGRRRIASPLTTVRRKKFRADVDRMLEALEGRTVGGWVLGLPVNMTGDEGPRCQSTRAFARNFARLTQAPILLWDERLSTVAAERALLEADASRRRRAEVIDAVAAAYILQGALDRLSALEPEDE
ncbi:Holliday junction resolvase RuvX [Albimonas pacifica]|uniref:Putative pre-16S rRNA nuclease n=1 Tax=Albimonas pacifica TaxID=1114924 RepID=A0A1I3CQB8_9RHOB|nr:Holliday junction resolvase RuvX [Albimonas pacifica]SFH76526.1 putative holliday junction resolvase [Albimonas pacifica]